MRRLVYAILVALFCAIPTTALASDDGGSYFAPAQAEPCGSYTWDANVDAGKTAVNDWSTATDGCHTYKWNGTVGASGGSGTTTFKVNKNAEAWELGVSPAGGNYCEYSKVHEANMAMAWHFKVADGTEVTVKYSCL
jgi:hypothetical protein